MFSSRLLRHTSVVALVTFTSLTMQPLQAALQLPKNERAKNAAATPDEKFSQALVDIHEILKNLAPTSSMPSTFTGKQKTLRAIGPNIKVIVEEEIKPLAGVDVSATMKELRAKLDQIGDYSKTVEESFSAVEKHIKDNKLPAEILSRHEAAVKEYQARKSEFESLSKAVVAADNANPKALPGALNALGAFFAKYPNEKTHTPTDPNKLPWGTPDGKVRKPYESAKEFKTSLFKEPRVLLAGPIPNGLTLPNTNLPATPVAADLAPTEDVQITPAIQALANSFNKNPVKIYNWVHNNIEFLPTYGSIQGADMTLQTKRGNAFDTASLLIGLLRASGIPARYAYGTIEVPIDKAMNWVGGVTKPEAALNLLGQGGIPNIGVISGGKFKSVKLEHVWVEAWVDYVPSRGAVNKVGDTWVKMDASFKQYKYTQGMDIKAAVPFDANALVTQAQLGATLNQAEGSVQNLNQTIFQTALTNYQNQVSSYINNTKPNATAGDVLGTKIIQLQNHSILLGSLPYKTIATGGKFNVLPELVRHLLEYNLYTNSLDVALESPFLSFKQSLPKLAGKKITLSFAPASQADMNLIISYLPKQHLDGTPIQLSELPANLPGYLIRLTAELRVDGQIIASGGNFTMGTELASNIGLFDPINGWEYSEVNRPIAGEYIATAVDGAGVSLPELESLQRKLSSTQLKMEAKQYSELSKDDITGDILYSVVKTYFTVIKSAAQIGSNSDGVTTYSKPSFGNFLTSAQPKYFFGIPRNVSFPGVTMDIDRVSIIAVANDNNADTARNFIVQQGQYLSMQEHLVPERFFVSAQGTEQGVSAVKAIALAAAQGQKIFQITGANINVVLPQLAIDPEVKNEIQNAIAAGKHATVPQRNIAISGFTGVGYIISDPTSGAAAYKISGGANGAELTTSLSNALSLLSVASNDNAGLEILKLILDVLLSIIIEVLKSAKGAIIKEILGFIDTILSLQALCSGVQLIFVVYIYTVLTLLSIVLLYLLTRAGLVGVFLAIYIGAVISYLIGEFVSQVAVPLICTSKTTLRDRKLRYASL